MEAAKDSESWTDARSIDVAGDGHRLFELIAAEDGQYVELPENGFGGLVAWAAGVHHVRRTADHLNHQTRVTTIAGDETTNHVRPRSQQEQDGVDQDIDSYLRDAGIPPRPRGFRWFVELPGSIRPDDFWEDINTNLARDAATRPADVLANVRTTLGQIYSTS